MENYEIKRVHIKNRTCSNFTDLIKRENFDLNTILID